MPKTIRVAADQRAAFAAGMERIRAENQVPEEFPAAVLAAGEAAAAKPFDAARVDRTDLEFVTLDPLGSRDLDQAFAIERAGSEVILRYAIADVPWFVAPGDPIDVEAWSRGVTVYMPDARSRLYPPALSEGAASLLPDGDRPAVIFVVRIDGDGDAVLDGVERAIIRSRAQLAYETASAADLPDGFEQLAALVAEAEDRRGSVRLDTPEQEVVRGDDGLYRIAFRPRLSNEDANAAMSLATNLAIARLLFEAGTGLFRVMPEPDERAVKRLRHSARALGMEWPASMSLSDLERTLVVNDPKHAAFAVEVRRATGGASYEPFTPGVTPWHSAMAATYCHATAPLRRLADRHVIEAAIAVAGGNPPPEHVREAFGRLGEVMARADARAARVERESIDLIEAVVLDGREGSAFDAVVIERDQRGVRIQLRDPAVVARVHARGVEPGDDLVVRLIDADPLTRVITFERLS